VTTRFLICIRIQVGCSSSSCYPRGQQHMTQPCARSDVHPCCVRGKRRGPQLRAGGTKGYQPACPDVAGSRSIPGAGRFLHAGGGELSLEPNLRLVLNGHAEEGASTSVP